MSNYQKITLFGFMLISLGFIVIGTIGAFANYTGLPFWDSWGPTGISIANETGWLSTFWSQHNEHRPVITKMLYWSTETFFNGQLWVLIVINLLLTFSIAVTLIFYLHEQTRSESDRFCKVIISLVFMAWMFSWIQKENLSWEFQSQFYLVFLIPLIAFYCLYKSCENTTYFILSCVLGVICVGTMANGILALPLMVGYAFLNKMSYQKKGILLFLAILCLWAYLGDFEKAGGHESFFNTLLEHPIDSIRYVLRYMGGPFYYVFDKSLWVTETAGFIYCLLAAYAFFHLLQNKSKNSFEYIVFMGIVYILTTAIITAGGRLVFGFDLISSRYQTPAVIAWSLLIIFYAPSIIHFFKKRPIILAIICFVILAGMIPYQLKALKSKNGIMYHHYFSILGLELQADDEFQVKKISPDLAFAEPKYEILREHNLGVYRNPLIVGSRELIGKSNINEALYECVGSIEKIKKIKGAQGDYVRVFGFVDLKNESPRINKIFLIDENSIIVGMGLARNRRTPGGSAEFMAYLLKDKINSHIKLIASEKTCITDEEGE